jgi:glycosyltransferase involved in cell wall biosynthesis
MSAESHEPAVLFLLSTLIVGGSELKSVRLANALQARGVKVIVAYLNEPTTLRESVDERIPVIDLQRRGPFSLHTLRVLARAIDQHGVGSIVAVNLYPALYAVLARWLANPRRVRVLVSVNTTEFVTRRERWEMLLYRHVLARVDHVIFGAHEQAALWRARYGVGRHNSAVVVHNGVDAQRFRPDAIRPAELTSPRVQFLVGTVGKMRVEKAHVHLVQAVKQLRGRNIDVGLLIVGDGPERQNIAREIAACGLQEVVAMVGESDDVRPFLARMDVFALSSVAVETFSNATLEAMSMGRPIVSTRVGGMHEMLQFGGGVLVTAGDIAALAAAIEQLLRDERRRKELGRAARRAVEEHFTFERMVHNFQSALEGR